MNDQRKGRESRNHKELNLPANLRHAPHKDGNLEGNQCIEVHSFLGDLFLRGHDDGVPMNQAEQNAPDNPKPDAFHNEHNAPLDDTMLRHVYAFETYPFFDPPSNCCWIWNEDQFILLKIVDDKKIDAGICVRPSYKAVYSIIVGDIDILDLPTLHQAIYVAEAIAWAFKDSLPVPRMGSQHEPTRTERRVLLQHGW